MKQMLNDSLKVLLPVIAVLFIIQGSDVQASITGWDEYESCINEKTATELKQKYCSRDLEEAEDRIVYVEATFKETRIKLEGRISSLESQLKTAQEDQAATERTFYDEKTRLENVIAGLNSQIAGLHQQMSLLKDQMEQQKSDFTQQIADRDHTIQILKQDSGAKEQALLNNNDLLQKRYEEEVARAKSELLAEKNSTIKALEEQRNKYERQLIALRLKTEEAQKKQLADMEAFKNEIRANNQELEKLLALSKTQIDELKQIIRDRNNEIATLRQTSKAQQDELERMLAQEKELARQLQTEIQQGAIRLKKFQGKLIINIDNKISFDSGSASLKTEVKAAFNKISAILVNFPNNQILIEGHTDNVQLVSGAEFQDNWDLSTTRALSVLRFLLKNKALDQKRFSAVGYGEFNPIADNDTSEGRALNRRVDIVVVPRFN